MLPFKLVYHPRYDLRLGSHVFPSQKYRLIHDALLAQGIADAGDIVSPEPAGDEDVLRVHTAEWVHKLKSETRKRRKREASKKRRVALKKLRAE